MELAGWFSSRPFRYLPEFRRREEQPRGASRVSPWELVCTRAAFARPGPRATAFPGFVAVGSEEARSVTLTLASVRRSNGACSFPALRFHEDAYAGRHQKQSARPGCGPGYAVGSSDRDATSHRLVDLNGP